MKKRVFIKPGDKFGRLTALQYLYTGKHYRRYFLFQCDCGKEITLQAGNVISGNTKSCGCLSREVKRAKRLPLNKGVINHLILQYKRHAKRRGISYNLNYDEFAHLISLPCHYCGLSPSNVKYTKNCKEGFVYSGIDRVNPDMGYFTSNTVPACAICNRAKSHMSLIEFRNWVSKLEAMAEQWGG